MRKRVLGVFRAAPFAFFLALVLGAYTPPVAAGDASLPLVAERLGPVVRRTVERAALRFADPGCALLLHDFDDERTGRPLAETLAASGRTPSGFLASLRFVDADHMVQCRYRPAWAWIPVGGDVVFVCRSRFLALARKDEWLAGNILVHETLHSLGLGENPPSSEAITAAVVRRCGR
ncbi:MAG: hypothetical protein KJ062_00310 [Thermoanaerobaculia bacterium]|nr:hypothetical protein [Thermoanaerobaculia bacterium]